MTKESAVLLFWQLFKERFRGTPWSLLITVYLLVAIGLFNMYSASGGEMAPGRFNDQAQWALLGTVAMIFWGVLLDTRSIERLSIFAYIVVCAMLLAVDITGHIAKGSQRWLALGPVRIQPSELTKFVIILIVARSFAFVKGVHEFTLLTLWRQILIILVPFLLVLVQPDLGTSGLVLLIGCFQIAFVRVNWTSIAIVAFSGLSLSVIAWNFVLYDYQKLRVLNFLNPMRDPKGAGYHSIQSMIAVGSGGVWGRGFQQGTQSQLSFLPERHTDFAFSVWAEEQGFVGCLVVFGLYILLLLQIFQIAEKARDSFSALVALGVAGFFLFHFFINVAMVLGFFPVVGVPLSLVSYGGSHMLTVLSCVGLLIAVERRRAASAT
ncbi:MAG: rod shape-determining protein RodA [Betaproteobacteria bacterium]|nr:rod shape-determining protein RodA [Betaproteobacteria bacterium]